MIRVKFDSVDASRYVYNLLGNEEIKPPSGGWTRDQMLALAGACTYFCENYSRKLDVMKNHPEHLEADATKARDDVFAAVEYCGTLAGYIEGGRFDDFREPQIEFDIEPLETAGQRISAVNGFKDGWQSEEQ